MKVMRMIKKATVKLTLEGKFIIDWLSQCFNVFHVAMIEFS